jgi:hypothetical protein
VDSVSKQQLPVDPALESMPTEDAVAFLMREYNEDECTAHFMVGIAKGEIEGDAYAIDDESNPSVRPDSSAEAAQTPARR